MTHIIRVYGIVQGVGFRPTVARHAMEHEVFGTVSNKGPYVEIVAEGPAENLKAFESAVKEKSPKRSVILKVEIKETEYRGFTDFSIIESEKTKGEILISPDIAICEDCKREMYDRKDRRYLHPFINCTCCGPRLTILDALPYDRERTSMKTFDMCPICHREYTTPEDRRYDAQPVCCNECGPEVFLLDLGKEGFEPLRGKGAITKIRRTIADGKVVAIKGIGGYHLCCDATNENAVRLLRERKKRPMKPFAVMMKDIETAKKYCKITAEQEEILTGHQKPIILLEKKENTKLAYSVAPENPKAGVMLPYAPVQLLLFDYDDEVKMPEVLVMTSANSSGAPICRDEDDARNELSHLCDEILSHNRMIRLRADDTVMDFYKDKPYMIRRSRGYAPLPVVSDTKHEYKCVLAIGGELKNSFCIRVNDLFYMSPYIGDMEDIRTVNALKESIERFKTLLEVEPEAVVCDLHPRYNTTLVAESLGLPVYKVQHHYAHILSCMTENNHKGKVIGVSFDGTGFGLDNSIWGGEILLSDYEGFERSASIMPFKQIGGDLSAKEGYRIAASMIYGLSKSGLLETEDMSVEDIYEKLNLCTAQESQIIRKMYDINMNAVTSTSVGRLFDAVSAILGIRNKSTFEGEASTALMYKAMEYEKKGDAIEVPSLGLKMLDGRNILPTDELVKYMVEEKIKGTKADKLAYVFHKSLANMTIDVCRKTRGETGENTVALSGGCFQNTLLLKLTEEGLIKEGFNVIEHCMIPPNDGGLALGQAAYK